MTIFNARSVTTYIIKINFLQQSNEHIKYSYLGTVGTDCTTKPVDVCFVIYSRLIELSQGKT